MLDPRISPLQRLLRRHQTSVDICAALRLDRRDGVADGIAVGAAQAGRQRPVRGAVERDHADRVALAQHRRSLDDRVFRDIDFARAALERARGLAIGAGAVAGIHAARFIDHEHQRQIRPLLPITHIHIYRQRLLDRRGAIAADAIRSIAADHHQPAP